MIITPLSVDTTSVIAKSTHAASEIKQIPIAHTDVKFKSTRSYKDGNTTFVHGVSAVEAIKKTDHDTPGADDYRAHMDSEDDLEPHHILDVTA